MTNRTTYGFLHSGRLTNADPEQEFLKAVDGDMPREEVDFMGVECIICGKAIRDHSTDEIRICLNSPIPKEDD